MRNKENTVDKMFESFCAANGLDMTEDVRKVWVMLMAERDVRDQVAKELDKLYDYIDLL